MSNEQYEQIVKDIRDIKICLMGDLEDECSIGLKGEVISISRWRRKVNKVLWSLVGFTGSVLLLFIASLL